MAASTSLYFSTAAGSTYTDSGGSTAYSAFFLQVGRTAATLTQQSTAACLAGPIGATGILQGLTSTSLVWISEQLSGATFTTAAWAFNLWAQASTAGTNAGVQIRVQQLSSNSTWIQNFTNNEFGTATKSTAFTANNWSSGGSTTVTALTSGQRIAALVAINDATGLTMVAGGAIKFTFGSVTTAVSGDSWLVSPISLSTLAAAASTATFRPFANSLMSVGIGVVARSTIEIRLPPHEPDWQYSK